MNVARGLSALICLLVFSIPVSAFAAGGDKLFVGGMAGFGGEFDGDVDTNIPFNLGDFDVSDDMETTWGGFLHYETSVHRLFAIGGRFSFASFATEEMADDDWARNWALNADIAPKVRFGLSKVPVELYFTAPVGLSILFASDDWEDENIELDTGFDWNLSLLGGADFMVADDIGVFVEAGWMLQNISWEGENSGGTIDIDVEGDFSQTAVNVGLVMAL